MSSPDTRPRSADVLQPPLVGRIQFEDDDPEYPRLVHMNSARKDWRQRTRAAIE